MTSEPDWANMRWRRDPRTDKNTPLPPFWSKKGVYGNMGLTPGQQFYNSFALERGWHDSYHRGGNGVDFCINDERGAYSCLMSNRARNHYDQNVDLGDEVHFQQPTFGAALQALERNVRSREPVRLFVRTAIDTGPDVWASRERYVYRGMYQVDRLDVDRKVFVMRLNQTATAAPAREAPPPRKTQSTASLAAPRTTASARSATASRAASTLQT